MYTRNDDTHISMFYCPIECLFSQLSLSNNNKKIYIDTCTFRKYKNGNFDEKHPCFCTTLLIYCNTFLKTKFIEYRENGYLICWQFALMRMLDNLLYFILWHWRSKIYNVPSHSVSVIVFIAMRVLMVREMKSEPHSADEWRTTQPPCLGTITNWPVTFLFVA